MTTSDRIQIAAENDQLKLGELKTQMGLKTTGRAAFMKMLLEVQRGNVPAITGSPKQVVQRTIAARKKADKYSSWGWLSARAGVNEGTLKKHVAAAGYPVYGDRIVATRSAKKAKSAR
jgi:hypothetical protein